MSNGFKTPRQFARNDSTSVQCSNLEQNLYQVSLATDIIDARAFGGQDDVNIGPTKEAMISAAIQYAAATGKSKVFVPQSMIPYNASLVTFNSSVQLLREGNPTPIFDPIAYGADSTGVALSDSALSAWAASLQAGQKVGPFIGSYKVSTSITITSPTGITIDFGNALFTQTGSNKGTITLSNPTDCEIIGGRFVGKGTEHNGANAAFNGVAAILFTGNITNCRVHGVKAANHAGGSLRWNAATVNGLRYWDNTVIGIGTAGGIVAGDNNDDVGIGGYATVDNNVSICFNDISGHCFGSQVALGTGCIQGWNNFHDIPGQHAIYNAEQNSVLIIGNTFRSIIFIGVKNQIATSAKICSDITVIGNQMTLCGQTGISTQAVTFTNSYYQRVKVQSNHITGIGNGSSYGVQCDYVREYDCSDNTIQNFGAYGIFGAHCYGVVKKNTIKATSWNAISFASMNHDCEFSNNTIIDGVQNFEAGGDSNDRRYLIFLQKDAASLVANPKALVFGNTFRTTAAEGGFYLAAVFAATGVFLYYYGNNKNLTTKTSISMQTATDLQQCDVIENVSPAYGTNVFIDRSLGDKFNIVVTNGVGFTIQPPSNSTPGIFTLRIKNTSGGATGTNAFSGSYHLTGAWTAPANGFHRTITFYYDGSAYGEITRSSTDVAN